MAVITALKHRDGRGGTWGAPVTVCRLERIAAGAARPRPGDSVFAGEEERYCTARGHLGTHRFDPPRNLGLDAEHDHHVWLGCEQRLSEVFQRSGAPNHESIAIGLDVESSVSSATNEG
jgi:hypothetical protein